MDKIEGVVTCVVAFIIAATIATCFYFEMQIKQAKFECVSKAQNAALCN